jgi:hypothetical protein
MLEAFPRLGGVLCPPGWAESLLRDNFEEVTGAVFTELRRRTDGLDVATACELAWETIAARYFLAPASKQQQSLWCKLCDRDVRHALGVLERFEVLRRDGERVVLTGLGSWGMGGSAGAISQNAVLQVKIILLGVAEPPVWRRLLMPASIGLDRVHLAIQMAMGWEDERLHAFSDGSFGYSSPDWGLAECRDERGMTLGGLLVGAGGRAGYIYDFGDDWEHELVLEQTLRAEPGMHYPVCVAGEGACPPEDCGGVWGYMELRDALVNPGHERHEELLDWLGLQAAAGFDPACFEVDEVNRALAGGDIVAKLSSFGCEGPRSMAVKRAA